MTGKKTKILYVITKGNWGGAQRYVFDLATSLPKDQFEIKVAFGDAGNELEAKLKEVGISTIRLRGLGRDIQPKNDLAIFWQLLKLYKQEKPDIIHLNSPKVGGLGSLAGRLAGIKKIVYTAHGWAFNEDRPWSQKLIIKCGEWVTVLLSHQTICVAQNERKQMAGLPFTKNKLTTIYNGIHSIDFLLPEDARHSLFCGKVKNSDRVIGTIAELHPNKNLNILLKAVASLKRKDVYIALIGSGELENALYIEAKKLGLLNNTFFLGHKPSASKYLKAFDVFVLPSKKEGLPYTLLEAGLAGLPIVSTTVGGIPEIIPSEKEGLLVAPHSVEQLATALAFLLDHDKYRAALGKNIQKFVSENFTLERMVAQTADLYADSRR